MAKPAPIDNQKYLDAVANTAALGGVARLLLLSLAPADVVAVCLHAVRLVAEMVPPPQGLKPLLAHMKQVCASIVASLGDAADVAPSEGAEWALDLVEEYAKHGLGAPGVLHPIVEVCLRYVVDSRSLFAVSRRNVGGAVVECSENDELLLLPAPIEAPPEVAELAAHVYGALYSNMKAYHDAEAARSRRGAA